MYYTTTMTTSQSKQCYIVIDKAVKLCILFFLLARAQAKGTIEIENSDTGPCSGPIQSKVCLGGDVLVCCRETDYCMKGMCENCFNSKISDPLTWCSSSGYNISLTYNPEKCASACRHLISQSQWKNGKYQSVMEKKSNASVSTLVSDKCVNSTVNFKESDDTVEKIYAIGIAILVISIGGVVLLLLVVILGIIFYHMCWKTNRFYNPVANGDQDNPTAFEESEREDVHQKDKEKRVAKLRK